ncbi:MAG: glycosyltransferase family 2 protein [Saprospiraceae bacterium]|jgi:dolichol-phosphate mannosyltransferase|nr:glycosyltransferase family 2 protein [Saprospiraceae bacterium]
MITQPDISVVIPVYNEENNLFLLYERLVNTLQGLAVSFELLFVNDGSQDGSAAILQQFARQDARVKFIDFSRNFGHQIAVSAGIDHAQGGAIAIIDADLQDPPELIADLYRKMQEGFEVVYARRNARKGETWFKKWTAKMFYRLLSRITTINIPIDTGDFRIIHRKVADVLKNMPERHKYIRGQIAWIGFNQTYVMYDRNERHAGKTGYTLGKMARFALDGITAFSDFPLKIVSYFGLLVSVFAFLMTLYALYGRYILKDYVQGWTSLIISVLFIGGIQMIGIGIIGEYLSRMNADTRRRPLYIVRDSNIAPPSPPDESRPI